MSMDNTQSQLDTLTENLKSFVLHYNKDDLVQELARSKGRSTSNDGGFDELSQKAGLDKAYAQQLDICNKLWFIKGLLTELSMVNTLSLDSKNDDWQFIDLEASVSNYIKVTTRIRDLQTELNKIEPSGINNVNIMSDLIKEVSTIEENLLKLIKLIFIQYLQFDNELNVKFNSVYDETNIKDFFNNCFNYLLLTNGNNDNPDQVSITKLFNLNKLFEDWTVELLQKLDQDIYTLDLDYSTDGVSLKLVKSKKDGKLPFSTYIQSIENLVNFYNIFVDFTSLPDDQRNPVLKLKQYVLKPILKSLEAKLFNSNEDIYALIISNLNQSNSSTSSTSNPTIKSQLMILSQLISQPGWSSSGYSDIEFWTDDSVTYWINSLRDKTIDEIKTICIDLRLSNMGKSTRFSEVFDESNLISLPLNNSESMITDTQATTKHAFVEEQRKIIINDEAKEEDDNGWDNNWDDNWGDEDDEIEAAEPKETTKGTNAEEEEDDGWDAWNDDEEGWDDELAGPNAKSPIKKNDTLGVKSLSTNSNTSSTRSNGVAVKESNSGSSSSISGYKISKLPEIIIEVVDNFMKNYYTLVEITGTKDEDLKSMFTYEINKLVSSYFVLISGSLKSDIDLQYYDNPILFYNDFKFILDNLSSKYDNAQRLQDLYKLNYQVIHDISNSLSIKLDHILEPYTEAIFAPDNSTDDEIIESKAKGLILRLSNFFTDIFSKYYYDYDSYCTHTEICSNIIAGIVYRYHNLLMVMILNKTSIGDEESNILADLIDKSLQLTLPLQNSKEDILVTNLRNIQTFNKLEQIKSILVSNLKQILDKFYDAVFFDLKTQEIIDLIQALFVASALRQSTIEEIRSLREEADQE